jgi:hypothetical protein
MQEPKLFNATYYDLFYCTQKVVRQAYMQLNLSIMLPIRHTEVQMTTNSWSFIIIFGVKGSVHSMCRGY